MKQQPALQQLRTKKQLIVIHAYMLRDFEKAGQSKSIYNI